LHFSVNQSGPTKATGPRTKVIALNNISIERVTESTIVWMTKAIELIIVLITAQIAQQTQVATACRIAWTNGVIA